ncbi:MAG: anthranilate/aminodeoxychorismate synthase component II, partial [Betaproteobacteria bacterium]|nr:anthranilate/aminodeoxychorismate synthase component II [Betaproteobacteria bacterium]
MLLMIDNYDSFTYNLVQYLRALGASVTTLRNDASDLQSLEQLRPKRLVIS